MADRSESHHEHQIEPGMIVLGADATLVGEVRSVGSDAIIVVRRPLPAITLPIDLVAGVVDGVAVLTVTADVADSLGEADGRLLRAGDAAAV